MTAQRKRRTRRGSQSMNEPRTSVHDNILDQGLCDEHGEKIVLGVILFDIRPRFRVWNSADELP